MLALGIVLIVLAVLFGLGVSVSSGESTKMSVFGVDFGLAVPTLFLLGAATGIALFLGLWLTKKGLGRGYRRHKEVRELRQQVAASPTTTEGTTEDAAAVEEREAVDAVTPRHAAPTHADDHPASSTGADPDSRTVDLDEGDRLATEHHTVAEGTDSRDQRR
jgi:hypothetical protein